MTEHLVHLPQYDKRCVLPEGKKVFKEDTRTDLIVPKEVVVLVKEHDTDGGITYSAQLGTPPFMSCFGGTENLAIARLVEKLIDQRR